jgi:glycosyltransferase involved in cell wall biosynthesis
MSSCISIITPCYNSEQTLERTIKSVLEQIHEDFELILLDDGSSDSTSEIIDKYSSINHKIKGYKLNHAGVSEARNFGVEKSTSQVITFLDSDDILYKNSLSERLKTFNKFKKDDSFVGVYCPARKILLNNKSMGLAETFYKSDSGNALVFGDTFKSPFIPSQVLIKKDKFLAAGGFKIKSGLCEDFLLWQDMMRNHQYFIPDERTSIGYTQRSGSVVHAKPYKHFLEFKNVLKRVLEITETGANQLLMEIYLNELARRGIYTLTLLVALGKKEEIKLLKADINKFEFQYFTPEQLANMFKSACVRVEESNLRFWDTIKKKKHNEIDLMANIISENSIRPIEYRDQFLKELKKNPVQLSRFDKAIKKYKKLSSQNKLFLTIIGIVYTVFIILMTVLCTYAICS